MTWSEAAWRKVGSVPPMIQRGKPVYASGQIGSLVMSDGTPAFPIGVIGNLMSRMTPLDASNTLDTARAAGHHSTGPYEPLFLFTIAGVCRQSRETPSSEFGNGWWKPLLDYPNLCDALLECQRVWNTSEFEQAHLHYETLRRLICAEEPRLRLLPE